MKNNPLIDDLVRITSKIYGERFPSATVIFLAGSLVRGEGTKFSDLDLVVVFDRLKAAYRESFTAEGFPVECFVHDPETLNYFFHEADRPEGECLLANMVVEGIEIPAPSELSKSLKVLAQSVLDLGPPELSLETINAQRYNITNLIDDIRESRSSQELAATGTELYQALANFYLRTNGRWGAHGKSIPRALAKADAGFCELFTFSFKKLFANNQQEQVIKLTEDVLKPYGGFLFDGYKLVAPKNFRKPIL